MFREPDDINGLSLVIPVYNEAGSIEKTLNDIQETVIKRIPGSELIIAEDGSTDGTREMLEGLKAGIPFTLISSPRRKGYAMAFKDSLMLARKPLVFFSDSDGQHDPEDIFRLLREIEGNDIVSGCKSPRRDRLYRVVISRLYNLIIGLVFGLWMRDIDSGFKLIRKEVIEKILPEVDTMDYCVMSEFVLRAYLEGFKIKEVPVRHIARSTGPSRVFRVPELPAIALGLLRNLFSIRCNYKKDRS